MCARRFLTAVFILILIAVAGAFAMFQWGGNVLLKSAVPRGHFQAPQAGSGPDYTDLANWVAKPALPGNPAEWLPPGVDAEELAPAAVFYIHPTTYLETDRWNAPLRGEGDTAFRTELFVRSQASAFTAAGQIWAPRYRQAAFGAFLLKGEDARRALDLAYSDVSAAFDQFLRESGERPIILAGHSQGALHLERLLKEKIAGRPVAKRIVAAYVVGWPIDRASDLPALGLPACTAPEQAGCILSWLSFGDPPNPRLILDQWEKTQGLAGGKRSGKDLLCVNPISGTAGGSAPPEANPGTLVPTADLRSATLERGIVGGRCSKGLLIVEGDLPPLGPFVLPGNNYHVYDYALFWGAIRRDAARRLSAWRP